LCWWASHDASIKATSFSQEKVLDGVYLFSSQTTLLGCIEETKRVRGDVHSPGLLVDLPPRNEKLRAMTHEDKNHFDIGQWCDYVRGLLDTETEAQMRHHHESSQEAGRQVAALRQIEALAEHDRTHAPPAWVVRSAKAIGSLFRSDERPSFFQRIAMSLSFDSLASPALVGTRDVQTLDRHLIFDTDGYRVDLRIEPDADRQGTALVGQLLQTRGKVVPLVEVPVLAIQGQNIVGQAKTGRFGEFQAAGLPGANLSLCLLVEDETVLEIDLGHNDPDGNHPGESA
jgi:hypothetical protein